MNNHRRRAFVLSSLLLITVLMVTAVLAQDSSAQDYKPNMPDPKELSVPVPIVGPDWKVEGESGAVVLDAVAASAENVEFIGQIGGDVGAVAALGDYAYIGEGPRVVVLDISDPWDIAKVGQTLPLSSLVLDITLDGNFAYVAGDSGLYVIDIGDPYNPVEVSFVETARRARAVAKVGNYVYLAASEIGLRVIDVSDPNSPIEAGYFDTAGYAYDVAIDDSFAFVADGNNGLCIINIAIPSNPLQSGNVPFTFVQNVEVSGDFAYVDDSGDGRLHAIDISDPSSPSETSFFDLSFDVEAIASDETYIYLSGNYNGLHILDISDPSNLLEIGSISSQPWGFYSFDVANDQVYLADHWRGLRVVNVTSKNTPFLTGMYRVPGWVYDMSAPGIVSYAGGSNGLSAFDITDPASPVPSAMVDYLRHVYSVATVADLAFITNWSGLHVFDTSDPLYPLEIGAADTPGAANYVEIKDQYAYIADGWEGLRIIDVADPLDPIEIGSVVTPGDAKSVAVTGDYAFVADWDGGLRIIDISDPAHPFEASSYIDTVDLVKGVAISGTNLFVGDVREGLRILDITDPITPIEISSLSTISEAGYLQVAGDYAYISGHNSGLRIVNITDVESPIETAYYDTPGAAMNVSVSGDNVYVADYYGGLYILQHREIAPSSITIGKLAEPADDTNFTFDGDLGSFTLRHEQEAEFDGLFARDYVIRETNTNAWHLKTIPCNTSNVTRYVDRVVIHLEPGEDVTCYFVNEPRPTKAENVEFTGHIGGATFATAVQGDYAYYGEGPQLVITDISDPATATIIGKTSPLDGVVGAIDVSGSYAYVAARYSGLHIIDISDPTDPVEIGRLYTAGDAIDVAVAGKTVYLADSVGGMLIIDVSDPTAPNDLGSFGNGGEFSLSVAADGSYAYYTDGWRLSIVEPSNPAEPIEIGYFEAGAERIHLAGTSLYVAGGNGLTIIDITNPTTPVEISTYPTLGYAYDVAIDGNHAYISNSNYLTIIDIADPTNPLWERDIELPDTTRNVAVENGFVYIATDTSGLRIIDLSQRPDPLEVASFDAPSLVIGAAVEGDYAYLSSGSAEGLQIVNISNPAEPAPASYLDTHYAYQTAISRTVAYVADGIGLRIVDISDPTSPTEIGFLSTPGSASDVIVQGNYAYVVLRWDGIYIVDISVPNNPEEVVFYSVESNISRLALVNDYAYVATTGGLLILDISDPGSPSEVGSFITGEPVKCIGVDEDLAVIGSGYRDVYLVDVSDPADPQEIEHFENKYTCRDIAVDGIFFYIISGWNTDNGGLQIFDISIPSAPVEIGHYQTAWSSGDVTIAQKGIYLADGWGGFYGLKFIGYGSVTIEMLTEPGSTASFSFTGDLGDFSLANGESQQFTEVLPGDLSVIEGDRTGWYLDRTSCTGGDTSEIDDGVTIHLETGDNVHCTFINRRYSVTADAGGPYSGKEGSYISLDASGTTHQEMIREYKWDCTNDGVFEKSSPSPTGKSCKYNDNGSYTVKLRTIDIFGKTSEDTAQVTVNNVAPTVDAGSDETVKSGEEVEFSGSFYDPGSADTHTILWTFGDGASASGTLSPSHTYREAGSYTVRLTVTDDDGGSDSDELALVVNNSPPQIRDVSVSDDDIDEGDSFVLLGSIADDNPSSKLSLFIDWGDGHEVTHELSAGSTSFSVAHTCIDDDPSNTPADSYLINIKLSDEEGAFSTATVEVTVNNVAPVIDAGPDQEAIMGEVVDFAAVVSDAGAADTHTVSWDFGDGSAPVTGKEATHVFDSPGTYTVTVTVEDDDGGMGEDLLTVEVVDMILMPLIMR